MDQDDDRTGFAEPGSTVTPIGGRRRPSLVPGTRVRYRTRADRAASGRPTERQGTIAGPPLRDIHTSTTWVPVHPAGAPDDEPPVLIRDLDLA